MRPFTRALFVENLETRRLLAGNVTASLSGSDLFVTGDVQSNTITIESDGAGGLRVLGFNDATGQPTSINGTPNGAFTAPSFSGNVFVAMNEGNDEVRLTRADLPGLARVDLGIGNDSFVAGLQAANEARFGTSPARRLGVNGDLVVLGGGGNDDVRLQSVYVAGAAIIDTGDNNDTITLLPAVGGNRLELTSGRIDVGGTMTIVPGNGADTVSVNALSAGGDFVLDDAQGPLTANLDGFRTGGSTFIYGTPEADSIDIRDARVTALLQVISESGDDQIDITASRTGNLNINSGLGNDTVNVVNVTTPRSDIQLDLGNDRLTLRDVAIERLFAFGNEGDDVFNLRGGQIGEANFYGDGGSDALQTTLAEPTTIGTLNTFSIERRRAV